MSKSRHWRWGTRTEKAEERFEKNIEKTITATHRQKPSPRRLGSREDKECSPTSVPFRASSIYTLCSRPSAFPRLPRGASACPDVQLFMPSSFYVQLAWAPHAQVQQRGSPHPPRLSGARRKNKERKIPFAQSTSLLFFFHHLIGLRLSICDGRMMWQPVFTCNFVFTSISGWTAQETGKSVDATTQTDYLLVQIFDPSSHRGVSSQQTRFQNTSTVSFLLFLSRVFRLKTK